MDLIFKIATENNSAKIAEIYNNYIGNATLDLEERDANYFKNELQNLEKKEQYYIAILKDVIIGFGRIKKYSYKLGYQFASETSVFLHPNYLRKGYGIAFKKYIIKCAKSLGYNYLVAKIFSTNKASIQLNYKLGYELVGVQKKIGFANGKWVDTTILGLNI